MNSDKHNWQLLSLKKVTRVTSIIKVGQCFHGVIQTSFKYIWQL